jgi:mono/diheme cytochrome c family protein
MFATGQSSPQPQSRASVVPPDAAEVASGKKIYGKQCEVCHFSGSKAKKIGVGLAGIYAVGKFTNGKKVDDAAMRQWIEAGGKDMPGFKDALKPNEVRDLIAYLRTL